MCETIFNDIEQAAREASEQIRGRVRFTGGKVKLSRSEKLKWPFLQPSMDTLRNDLKEAKGTLMLMLQVNLLAFIKKTAEIVADMAMRRNQTTSTNIVEQREIINAILVIQQQQQGSQDLKLLRLSPRCSSGDKPETVTSNTVDKTSSSLDAGSTFALNRFSNSTKTLPTRPNVFIALPSPKAAITETTPKESMSSRANRSVTIGCHADERHIHREDATASSSGQSALRCDSTPTPAESNVGNGVESFGYLRSYLMKPVIQDLGDVIQLSWKIHSILMQQAEIRNQISKNEQEGLPLVNEVYQNLYAHEHAALEDTISKDGASFDVSLRSLKRIYIDLTHREILFKGIPGLEFVLERTIEQPFTQSLSLMRAQAEASAPLQPSGSAHGKKIRLGDSGDNTSKVSAHGRTKWMIHRLLVSATHTDATHVDTVLAPARSPIKEDGLEVTDQIDEKRSRGGTAARRFRERREAKQAQQEALVAELDIWKKRAAEKGWRPEESAVQGGYRPMTLGTLEPYAAPRVRADKVDSLSIDGGNVPKQARDTGYQFRFHEALSSGGSHRTLRRKANMSLPSAVGTTANGHPITSQAREDEARSHDDSGFPGFGGSETKKRRSVRQTQEKQRIKLTLNRQLLLQGAVTHVTQPKHLNGVEVPTEHGLCVMLADYRLQQKLTSVNKFGLNYPDEERPLKQYQDYSRKGYRKSDTVNYTSDDRGNLPSKEDKSNLGSMDLQPAASEGIRIVKSSGYSSGGAVAARAGQISSIGAGQGDSTTAVRIASPAGPWENVIKRSRSRSDSRANGTFGSLATTWTKWTEPPNNGSPRAGQESRAADTADSSITHSSPASTQIQKLPQRGDSILRSKQPTLRKENLVTTSASHLLHSLVNDESENKPLSAPPFIDSQYVNTPSAFNSYRASKEKDSQPVIQQKPEDFMDEEDTTDAEKAKKLQTAESFAGFSEDDDVTGQAMDEKEVDRIVGELLEGTPRFSKEMVMRSGGQQMCKKLQGLNITMAGDVQVTSPSPCSSQCSTVQSPKLPQYDFSQEPRRCHPTKAMKPSSQPQASTRDIDS
ncbi:MAG: hypothetical protein Q9221_004758 [Calogaya cf. arnoldii]